MSAPNQQGVDPLDGLVRLLAEFVVEDFFRELEEAERTASPVVPEETA